MSTNLRGYILDSEISSSNSSTDILVAGASFPGAWDAANIYPDVLINCKTDQAGTLSVLFSLDGGSTTESTITYKVKANTPLIRKLVKGQRAVKVTFENTSASDQTDFDLQIEYGHFNALTSPLNLSYSLDSDSQLVRPTWTWLDIARGLATDITTVKKFGRNAGVGTSFTPVALGGIYQTPQAASATALRIKAGGNANDTAAGTGAREVTLVGLDENFAEVSEAVATAGASASSATTTTFTRLFRVYVSSSGTYATSAAGSHAGNIVIENGAGGTDWATIDSTNFPLGQTEIGAYTIPTGYTGYVKPRNVAIDSGKAVDIVFFFREGVDETAAPYTAMRAQAVQIGLAGGLENFAFVEVPYGPYVGPCDVGFMAEGSATASVSVEFEIFLLPT